MIKIKNSTRLPQTIASFKTPNVQNKIYQWYKLINFYTLFIIFSCCSFSSYVIGQVSYDNNATVIGAVAQTGLVQGAFTVPSGDDRVLIAFVTRDGFNTSTDSITFNGQHLELRIQQSGGGDFVSQLWYLKLGCGAEVNDQINGFFSGGPDVIISTATFQNADQYSVFGASNTTSGFMSFASISINTEDGNGMLIGSGSVEWPGAIGSITATGVNQTEIFETSISGNNNSAEGSTKPTTGGNDVLSWSTSNSANLAFIGIDLLASDSDGDDVPDCNDLCPTDPLKSVPGDCGCGVPETDTDNDGTPDCIDLCPNDILKIAPGFCGCGVPETDTDNDGIPDCIDVDVIRVKDGDNNILFEINDEGLVGSITLKDTSIAPEITSNKIYGINGALNYNGISLGSQDSSAGWTHSPDIVKLSIFNDKVGIGSTNPLSKLSINGDGLTNASLSSENLESSGIAVYGIASNLSGINKGGYFESSGSTGRGVEGLATNSGGSSSAGGYFTSQGTTGTGVVGSASNSSGSSSKGGVFTSQGTTGIGVFGHALSNGSGLTYGGHFLANSSGGIAVYGDGGANGGYFLGSTAVHGSGFLIGGNFEALNSGAIGVKVESGGIGVHSTGVTFDFFADGAGTDYGSSSSRRWKTDIIEIGNPLKKLKALRGVYYTWDEKHGGQHDVGMIAEEVGEVLPEIVDYEENGIDAIGMDYSKLTPLLVEAVKELSKQVEYLSKRNAQMELINAQLKSDVGELKSVLEELRSKSRKVDSSGN